MSPPRGRAQPVGYLEIADLLDVSPVTVRQWKWKGDLPAADYDSVHGMPAWERSTIIVWAGRLGKLRHQPLIDAYRTLTGEDPAPYRRGGRLPQPKAEEAS